MLRCEVSGWNIRRLEKGGRKAEFGSGYYEVVERGRQFDEKRGRIDKLEPPLYKQVTIFYLK